MRHSILSFTKRARLLALSMLLAGCQSQGPASCGPPELAMVQDALTLADFAALAAAPADNQDRERLASAYLKSRCGNDILDYAIRHSRYRNHACVVDGKSPSRIILAAHYDKTAKGQGVADNWSGVVITTRLLTWFREHPPAHTLEFIFFGEEEPGMRGSRAFLRNRDVSDVIAMVNIDTVGLGPLTIDKRSADGQECLARRVATSMDITVRSNTLGETTGDWEPFKRRGVPVLNLHSLDRRSVHIVHSNRDTIQAVDAGRLEQAYRLILNTVVNLDSGAEATIEF